MKRHSFSLRPFSSESPACEIRISGQITRDAALFALDYTVAGNLSALAVPVTSGTALRRDGLWGETCFEFFIAPENLDVYWESNLSPSGNWNVYRFDSYRNGMTEEAAFTSLPFSVDKRTGALLISVRFDSSLIIKPNERVRAGISAVLKSADGEKTFWALVHPGRVPDFHRKDSFLLEL